MIFASSEIKILILFTVLSEMNHTLPVSPPAFVLFYSPSVIEPGVSYLFSPTEPGTSPHHLHKVFLIQQLFT